MSPYTCECVNPLWTRFANAAWRLTLRVQGQGLLLRELNEALKSAEPIQFPTNIELVTKYYDKIDATTIAVHDDSDSHPTSSAVRTISE